MANKLLIIMVNTDPKNAPELGAPFLGTWYLLGMLIPTAFGALAGPRLLRW